MRWMLNELSKHENANQYCGLPLPIAGERLILEKNHPAYLAYAAIDAASVSRRHTCSDEDINETTRIRNTFYSHRERCDIVIYEIDGKIEWGRIPAIHHFRYDIATMGCSVAWSVESEIKAMDTLSNLIPKHLFDMYFLTGMFLETSRRSGLTYVFRRLKPTVVLREDKKDNDMKILTTLCLHPIGYYEETWAGGLCPTDDVLSHLLLMRGDEPMFWKRANHHSAHRPEAGL